MGNAGQNFSCFADGGRGAGASVLHVSRNQARGITLARLAFGDRHYLCLDTIVERLYIKW